MPKHRRLAPWFQRPAFSALATPAKDLTAALATVCLLNLLAWVNLRAFGFIRHDPLALDPALYYSAYNLKLTMIVLACNLLAVLFLLVVRRRVVTPWRQLRHIVRHASQAISEERGAKELRLVSVRELTGSIARFAAAAQEAYTRNRALQHELEESRQMMAQIAMQHQVVATSTSRELIEQYRSVLSYAHYLDEHIRSHQGDAQLRYDFDDVCESGFNLKLIAQSLELLRTHTPHMAPVPLETLLQQTVIALAPSLERRVMKLSTAGVENEVVAATDIQLLSHAVWMMLLGTIRYAAAESTLRLRCIAGKDGQAIISIGINELEPGQLSPQERHAHMLRQLQHTTPHLFAETIRAHANAQLAGMMLSRVGGVLSVLPISTHACEISLILPLVKK